MLGSTNVVIKAGISKITGSKSTYKMILFHESFIKKTVCGGRDKLVVSLLNICSTPCVLLYHNNTSVIK